MSSSMKDALIKAGLVSKETIRKEKVENTDVKQKGIHEHHLKTYCPQCNKNAEDVEYYNHTNRSLKSPWLCLVCADKFNIHDDMRQTQQSPTSRAGRFQRFYGPTKRFAPGQGLTAPSGVEKPRPSPTAHQVPRPQQQQRKFSAGSGPKMPGSRMPSPKPTKK